MPSPLRNSAPWILALFLAGCGARTVGHRQEGHTPPAADAAADPASCRCDGPKPSGELLGEPIEFHAAFGVYMTWGSHAEPIHPMEAVALTLLLTPDPLPCPERTIPDHIRFWRVALSTAEQAFGPDKWSYRDRDVTATTRLQLDQIPIARGDHPPLSDPGPLTGCLDLVLAVDGNDEAGRARGCFSADYCSALDSASGE